MTVSLDPSFGDPLNHRRVSNNRLTHQWDDLVIDIPGVGGGFEDNSISREQVGPGPERPFLHGYSEWIEDYLLLPVESADDDIMLVQVEG
jgi:hypothetical protein